jgi:hypothetical protein
MIPPLFGKQEVGVWRVQKRFPQYGIPIWSLWPNIRFLPSIVAEKNVTKNGHIQNVCSMCIKINSRQTGNRNLMGPKTLPTIWGTYMKLVTKYQIAAINSCWEKCDEKCAYMFNVYKNQLSRQTGSRNLTGPKTLPTIWYTYMTLVTKNVYIHKWNLIVKHERHWVCRINTVEIWMIKMNIHKYKMCTTHNQ